MDPNNFNLPNYSPPVANQPADQSPFASGTPQQASSPALGHQFTFPAPTFVHPFTFPSPVLGQFFTPPPPSYSNTPNTFIPLQLLPRQAEWGPPANFPPLRRYFESGKPHEEQKSDLKLHHSIAPKLPMPAPARIGLPENSINCGVLFSDFLPGVVSRLKSKELSTFSMVSKGCYRAVFDVNKERRKAIEEHIFFGKDEWNTFFDLDIGFEPRLPHNIVEILDTHLPFDEINKICNKYFLVVIPNGLNALYFNKYSDHKLGTTCIKIESRLYNDLAIKNSHSRWLLIEKAIVDPVGYNQKEDFIKFFSKINESHNQMFRRANVLEIITSLFMIFFKTKELNSHNYIASFESATKENFVKIDFTKLGDQLSVVFPIHHHKLKPIVALNLKD